MIQEIYAYLYSRIHIKFACRIISRILYIVRTTICKIKGKKIKERIISIENSRNRVTKYFSKPEYNINISNKDIDESIDISVIVPIYNYKDLISYCLDSVINQKTKYHFEIIIIDDGSNDGSYDVVEAYSKYDNVVIIHKQNGGIGSARNAGIDNARGKYIMFVDCDDYVHEDYIESMLDKAYETNDDIVICGYTLIKKNGDKIISKRDILYSEKNLCGFSEKEKIMNYQGLPWNKIYKRELWMNVRYIPGFWYEDTIIHFLIFRMAKSYSLIEKSFYDYMWYENNFSHTQNKKTVKSLQKYWLMEVMVEETKRLGLPIDGVFYEVLLRHLGPNLYYGTIDLDEDITESVFCAACDLLDEYRSVSYSECLTKQEKSLDLFMKNRDISHWGNICRYM